MGKLSSIVALCVATIHSPGLKAAILSIFLFIILMDPAHLNSESPARQIPVTPPPMGWSSWNSFSNTVNSQVIVNQAKALIATGLRKAGYQYINIDEGWWLGKRDPQGNILVDPAQWPALAPGEHAGDMANIVRYLHRLGLRAGIYTDAGADGCSTYGPDLGPSIPHTGSEGHYDQDFLQFAEWGFDYVKVDWCGGNKENLDPAIQYGEIAGAIAKAEAATSHHLYFSICDWGKNSPWSWAPNIGGVTADIWRTSGDIVAPIVANTRNSGRKASFPGVLSNFDQGIHPEAQHTGFFNDPDMMVIGMPGLSEAQNRVHMSLWAISGAPLLVGADLTKLNDATLNILTNPAVLAVDQDTLGLQAVKVAESGPGLEVWSKPLSVSGQRAVLLLNRTPKPAPITVRWSDLGLLDSSSTVSDLWARKDLGAFNSAYSATVPPADAMLLLVRGSESKPVTYWPGEAGQSSTHITTIHPGQSTTFRNVASHARIARIQIVYANPDKTSRFADLHVNGQTGTRIAFPPTGTKTPTATISIMALLDRVGPANVLTFSTQCDQGPAIASLSIQ